MLSWGTSYLQSLTVQSSGSTHGIPSLCDMSAWTSLCFWNDGSKIADGSCSWLFVWQGSARSVRSSTDIMSGRVSVRATGGCRVRVSKKR